MKNKTISSAPTLSLSLSLQRSDPSLSLSSAPTPSLSPALRPRLPLSPALRPCLSPFSAPTPSLPLFQIDGNIAEDLRLSTHSSIQLTHSCLDRTIIQTGASARTHTHTHSMLTVMYFHIRGSVVECSISGLLCMKAERIYIVHKDEVCHFEGCIFTCDYGL